VWLAQTGIIRQQKGGVTRATSVTIRARNKKNKTGMPYRECDFEIKFGYGVDDITASLNFLKSTKRLHFLERGMTEKVVSKFQSMLDKLTTEGFAEQRRKLNKAVREAWADIERDFLPKRRKYA
jgi:hypothetical protein